MVNADLLDAVDRSLRQARSAGTSRSAACRWCCSATRTSSRRCPAAPRSGPTSPTSTGRCGSSTRRCGRRPTLGIVELDLIHRQRDEEFRSLLTAVRHGRVTAEMAARLNGMGARPVPADPPLTLASRNDTVAASTRPPSPACPARRPLSVAEVEGDFGGRAYPADEELRLKVGAQVMLLRNDADGRWVNGIDGRGLADAAVPPSTVEIDGEEHEVDPVSWESYRYTYSPGSKELKKEVVAEFRSSRCGSAWAVTIHKSQGKTLRRARSDRPRAQGLQPRADLRRAQPADERSRGSTSPGRSAGRHDRRRRRAPVDDASGARPRKRRPRPLPGGVATA